MTRFLVWLALLLPLSAAQASTNYFTISGIDPGGVIVDYINRYKALEATGATVKVDGLCISACTLVLAIFPPERVCMTERGSFGFHEASIDGNSDAELTKAWLRLFPEWVLKWISDTGALTEAPRYMFAEDAKGHITLCPGSQYINVDMKKLVPSQENQERILFRPN